MTRFYSPLLLLMICAGNLLAQTPALTIPRLEGVPSLEDFTGMAPSTKLAQSMGMVKNFIQREPTDGEPATHDTHVFLGYDQRNFYAVFLAFDSEPEMIRARMAQRENVFDDDYVDLQIDTFNDRRRGYTFLATPLGIQWDALYTEGQGFDESYNAVWYSSGRLTDQGYMVMMTIPFTTLRFSPEEEQTWGIILNRTIPRLSEESFWPRYSNLIEGRLNQAATLTGIKDVSPGRNIQITPYVFARNLHIIDREQLRRTSDDFDPDAGVDAKFVVKDAFVLDVTANPDFSQVESDEPQVTVNQRFEVRFPEKRPFFLENADFFNTPTTLLFTRRIVDPRAGLRFTGKKNGWGLGVLLIDDEAPGNRVDPTSPYAGDAAEIGVFRLKRDLGKQSTLGLMVTSREFGDDKNQVYGLDGRIKLDDNWVASFQASHSESERAGISRNDNAYTLQVDRSGRHLNIHNHLIQTDPNFVTRLGFIRGEERPNSRNAHHRTAWIFRPEKSSLIDWTVASRVGRIWDLDGEELDTFYDPEIVFTWPREMQLVFGYHYNQQRLTQADYNSLTSDVSLSDRTYNVSFRTSYWQQFNFSVDVDFGNAINFEPASGKDPEETDGLTLEFNCRWRPISPLMVDGTWLYVKLDEQREGMQIFDNTIWRVRANWQFTRELSLRVISQMEDTDPNEQLTALNRSRNWNNDVLMRYVLNPWTALYLGYNSNESNFQLIEGESGNELVRTDGQLHHDGRQFFLKFNYLFQF